MGIEEPSGQRGLPKPTSGPGGTLQLLMGLGPHHPKALMLSLLQRGGLILVVWISTEKKSLLRQVR